MSEVAGRPAPRRVHALAARVYYGDTDQMGVAYYANYLRWFEMARNEYLRAVGCTYARLEADGVRLPVVEVGCRYLQPARYDDDLRLEAWIEDRSRVRVRFEYRIVRARDEAPLAQGFTIHACLGQDGAPQRLPRHLLEELDKFESGRYGG